MRVEEAVLYSLYEMSMSEPLNAAYSSWHQGQNFGRGLGLVTILGLGTLWPRP